MNYLAEFRVNWRALVAASIGLAFGYTLNNFLMNIFSPHLIREFGWSKSDFALLGLSILVAAVCQPIAGRVTDALGVRRMAMMGAVASPLIFVAYSLMSGDFTQFYLLYVLQIIVVGGTTSVVVYSRIIAQSFDTARGMALGVASCAPALIAAATMPFLSGFIDDHGWRAGYLVAAAVTAVANLITVLMIPKSADRPLKAADGKTRLPANYPAILRNPAFLIIAAGMLFCNLTLTVQMSQVKLILLDLKVTSDTASLMLSLYAVGMITGRLLCGVALDRFSAHLVAVTAMAMPAIGLFILASGTPSILLLSIAILLLGVSLGAEGDVGAYLVMRYFNPAIFSTVYGLIVGVFSLSGAIGALVLSLMLKATGSFSPFLILTGVAALVGGGLFVLLARLPPAQVETRPMA